MPRVLFMEDEPTICDVTAEYMKMQNYEVTIASDGCEAIELLKNQEFELAVLDIMVPKISGLEVLAYIKENNLNVATIMLTALGDEQTQVKAFNLYADDYVIKPFSPILLLKRMETVLRRTLSSSSTVSEEKGLYINEEAYQAFYDKKSLGLTLSEFLLLQTLKREPNRVFTREQLILRIFSDEYVANDRTIDAHVKNLRKKLPRNFIKTVTGVGYQFCEGGDE